MESHQAAHYHARRFVGKVKQIGRKSVDGNDSVVDANLVPCAKLIVPEITEKRGKKNAHGWHDVPDAQNALSCGRSFSLCVWHRRAAIKLHVRV